MVDSIVCFAHSTSILECRKSVLVSMVLAWYTRSIWSFHDSAETRGKGGKAEEISCRIQGGCRVT